MWPNTHRLWSLVGALPAQALRALLTEQEGLGGARESLDLPPVLGGLSPPSVCPPLRGWRQRGRLKPWGLEAHTH